MTEPILFLSHGSPLLALHGGAYGEALGSLGRGLSPKAILSVSAHWEAPAPLRLTAAARPGILHDFGGFPEALYAVEYPAPGDPELAATAAALLQGEGFETVLDEIRPLDHGTWSPLVHLFPEARIPVVQVSLPRPRQPEELHRMGRALAPLRESGVLILGSGGMVHNLQRLDWRGGNGEPEAWAADFDAWAAEALSKGDSEALLDWQRRAPEAQVAHPSTEHWDPLLVTLGAAGGAPPSTIFQGWEMRNLSLRCVSWS